MTRRSDRERDNAAAIVLLKESVRSLQFQAVLARLLEGLRLDDVDSYRMITGDLPFTVPGDAKPTTYYKHDWFGVAGSQRSVVATAILDYEHRANLRVMSAAMTAPMNVIRSTVSPSRVLIAALIGMYDAWGANPHRPLQDRTAAELSAQFISREETIDRLNRAIRNYSLECASRAGRGNSEDDFWALYWMRWELRPDRRVAEQLSPPDGLRLGFSRYQVDDIKWTDVVDWADLVTRWIEHPTLFDFGLDRKIAEAALNQLIVNARAAQSRTIAKQVMAYIHAGATTTLSVDDIAGLAFGPEPSS